MTFRAFRSLGLAAALLAQTGSAAAQSAPGSACDHGEDVFYGEPFTIEQIYELAAETIPAPSDPVFPDRATDDARFGAAETCSGGGLVGALNCVTAAIEGAGGEIAAGDAAPVSDVEDAARRAAEALAGATEPDQPPPPAEPRVVRQVLVLRPVLVPGAPGQVRLEPAGPAAIVAPEGLTEAEIADLSPRLTAQNLALLNFSAPFDSDAQEALIDGLPRPVPLPAMLPGGSRVSAPPTLSMGAECGSLFRALAERARLAALRAAKVARIAQLKKMLEDERAKAGLLGLVWDSEQADRLERTIAHEEGQLARIDRGLAEQQAIIDRRERVLTEDERQRELDAIKADPARLAAETQARREALIEAARQAADAKWLLIEGEAAYARQFAAHDAMIAAARERGEDTVADALEEDKARLEAARDSWRQHAEGMLDRRVRDKARLAEENRADGIGPGDDPSSFLLAEGLNPVEVLEAGARERARVAAERRAGIDAETLGGSATETYDLMDFGQDLYETNLEMQRDPALFYRRFGSYMQGAGEAAYDGVVDLAVIGVEAADLAGEAFESGLSDATGYEFNAFGRENLDTLVAAGDALSRTDALKIGELAGRVAEAADRRFGQLAASGEAGINEALRTTGYVAGSVLGAEELAIGGALRAASALSDAARGAEALTDAARLADNLSDASRAGDAARAASAAADAARISDAARAGDTVADAAGDAARAGDSLATDLVATAPGLRPTPTTPDPTPASPDPASTTPAPAPATPDPSTTTPTTPVPATPDPVLTTPAPPTATPDPTPTTPDPASARSAEADATTVFEGPGPVDADATTVLDPPGPLRNSANPVAGPEAPDLTRPDASAGPAPAAGGGGLVDGLTGGSRADTTPPVSRDAPTQPDPGTTTVREPGPEAPPVSRDAPTQPDPGTTTVREPGPEAPPVSRDAPAQPDPGTTTVREPGPEAPADPSAPRDPGPATLDPNATIDTPAIDPNGTSDLTGSGTIDDTIDYGPLPDPVPAAPRADPAGGVSPGAASPEPPRTVDPANAPRGPPAQPRTVDPIDKTRLDEALDESPDYTFSRPILDPDAVPRGGAFNGNPVDVNYRGEVRHFPGDTLTSPDGSAIGLGPVLGTGATATVFASRTDPGKVVRLVDYKDPGSIALDAVGRKVGEVIENPTGNGSFRLTRTDQEFIVTDPATGKQYFATVEENIAQTGGGITNAKDRFARRPPNQAEELTMALAMREMNNRGVVWTDHKPANFDIVPNPDAPTGYQMLIFDTGGIRPVSGASAASRAETAREVQRAFDRSPPANSPDFNTFKSSYFTSARHLDDRVFGEAFEVGVSFTPNLVNRPDRYLDLSAMPDEAFMDYTRAVTGRDVDLPVAPP